MKLMKVPIAMLRRLKILQILYKDDILLNERSQDYDKGCIDFSVTKLKLSDKFREISTAALSGDRISGLVMDSRDMTLTL